MAKLFRANCEHGCTAAVPNDSAGPSNPRCSHGGLYWESADHPTQRHPAELGVPQEPMGAKILGDSYREDFDRLVGQQAKDGTARCFSCNADVPPTETDHDCQKNSTAARYQGSDNQTWGWE